MTNEYQWVEKYRPQSWDEVVGFQPEVKKIQANLLKGPMKFQNTLLSGPAGTGKTTIARLIANTLLGQYRAIDYMELNASEERGIDAIRTKILRWANTEALGGGVKVVLLDEADEITTQAQQALRGIIEQHPKTKFILTCNNEKKISAPLKSRCAHYKLIKPDRESILSRLESIVFQENLIVTSPKDTLRALISECYPDIRMMVQTLQMMSAETPITKESIKSLKFKLLESTISKCFNAVMDGNTTNAITHMKELLSDSSFNFRGVIRYFMYVFIQLRRLYLVPVLAYYDRQITGGADMEIQMIAMMIDLINLRLKHKNDPTYEPEWEDWKKIRTDSSQTLEEDWLDER